MDQFEQLVKLVDLHMGDLDKGTRKWVISNSSLGGRGIFAECDINVGEVIFQERPILIGPILRQKNLHTCVVCYNPIDGITCACKNGCSLPVCDSCSQSNEHSQICELYRSWEPVDPDSVNKQTVSLLPIAKALFLQQSQKGVLYYLQANNIPKSTLEITSTARNFKKFPRDSETLGVFIRVLSVLNTVAFEAVHEKGKCELSMRGLYPLAGMMNHRCTPNTCHPFENDSTMILRAAKFIPKGSEITTTYTKILWSNISRRLFLNVTKEFICSCDRCRDPSENGTYLSALMCRRGSCGGLVIPMETRLDSPWECLTCHEIYNSSEMFKIQDFILKALNSKVNNGSLKDVIAFINEKVPKFCPSNSQYVVEAKLQIIFKMKKSSEDFTEADYRDKIRYCHELLELLDKLEAGECTIKELLLEEMRNSKALVSVGYN